MKFYFFNVTNYQELLNGTANAQNGGKPILDEIGPYTYREDRIKKDLDWTGSDNVTKEYLAFGQYKSYTFLPSESCSGCSEEDKGIFLRFLNHSINFKSVRIINMPAASFIAKVERAKETEVASGGLFPRLNEFFNEGRDELFKEVVVADFLFRGVDDGIVDWLMNDPLISILAKKYLPEAFGYPR